MNEVFHCPDSIVYYLFVKTEKLKTDLWTKEEIKYALSELVPAEAADELSGKILRRHKRLRWHFKKLAHAKKCNYHSKTYREIYYAKDTIPDNNKGLYSISNPLFDSRHQYAVISIGWAFGWMIGNGGVYLYKKVGGQWEVVKELERWET